MNAVTRALALAVYRAHGSLSNDDTAGAFATLDDVLSIASAIATVSPDDDAELDARRGELLERFRIAATDSDSTSVVPAVDRSRSYPQAVAAVEVTPLPSPLPATAGGEP